MKTDNKKTIKVNNLNTAKTFRATKEKTSKDIANMNIEQIKAYLKNKKVRH